MKVYFFGGKGGVGKTTISSAFAVKLSEEGKRVLLISTDPAHSLSDIFSERIEDEKEITKSLTVKEINIKKELEEYKQKVLNFSRAVLKPQMEIHLQKILHNLEESPGIEDIVIFETLSKEIVHRKGKFDVFVIDTAPTGHTLGLLKTVGSLGNLFEEIIKLKRNIEKLRSLSGREVKNTALEYLRERKRRFSEFSEIIYNHSEFIPILTPEKLPIEETYRLISSLRNRGINVEKLIVNKILPSESEDLFLKSRKEVEEKYIDDIKKKFSHLKLIFIPFMEKEIVGYDKLKEFSTLLSGIF